MSKPLEKLPAFGLEDYRMVLDCFQAAGYAVHPVRAMAEKRKGSILVLRHDVDLHIQLVRPMAALERERGIRSTYFIPLTQHYNPLHPPNRELIAELVSWGHEVGLHYDLRTYPSEREAAMHQLAYECELLGRLAGQPVRSISMHEPHRGGEDLFLDQDRWVHPHQARWGDDWVYISDSCRAWRDTSLLDCFTDARPPAVMLNLHPEVWLQPGITDRMAYLEQVLLPACTRQHREYFDIEVRDIWSRHAGARRHDEREQDQPNRF